MSETVVISDSEFKFIKDKYNELVDALAQRMDKKDKEDIEEAFELAHSAHNEQRRKSGEPYILHPLEVARICAEEIGLGATAVISAILHDVVEDSLVTLEEIDQHFGNKITQIVDGLTKLQGTYKSESKQAENLRKVLSTLVEDVRVVLIKMADRLHNLRTIGSMPHQKQLRIAAETMYIYTPLAHRLGLYNIKQEYQDICMRVSEPDIYLEIENKLDITKADREEFIQRFINPLSSELDDLEIPYKITGRVKSVSSIYNKLKKKKVNFDEIYDLFAIRIIADVPPKTERSACWQIYSIITDIYKPIPERLKDWITTPKSNGYESLHTTVVGPGGRFVEVQIRTTRMDEIAERGFAAHWKYKGIRNQNNFYDTWLDGIRDILENSQGDPVEFLNDFKTNLFQEEVYVYTPAGDLKILPKGATALDFAFLIHSDVGYHCSAVKVNNKLVPMGYKLNNGDKINVVTNKNQKPNEDWLKLVVTGKARSKIRSAIKEERKEKGSYGKEALQRKLRNMKLNYEINVDIVSHFFGFESRNDLYYAIATEQVSLSNLRKLDIEQGKFKLPKVQPDPEPIKDNKKEIKGEVKLLINGEPGDQYNPELATCCNPVMGDGIFAYVTSKNSIRIHRTSCPNATHMMANYGYRVMKAEWVHTYGTQFVAELIVSGIDEGPGVLEKITNLLGTMLGINIRSFNVSADAGYFEARLSILVMNRDQLNMVMRALKNLVGINNVLRVE